MGLDMYLRGEKFFWSNWENPATDRKEDGFKVQSVELALGYWRKHPNLHGYIVNTFAEGIDKCQRIELSTDDIRQIINAIETNQLPHTEGFFFGVSDSGDQQRKEDVGIFAEALKWLEGGDEPPMAVETVATAGPFSMIAVEPVAHKEQRVTRSVRYQASW